MTEIERIIQKGVISEDFLKEEERCGFTVSLERKKLWAIELDLLTEVDRICRNYNLKYFAFGGTLLGAMRHKGFIPWDDDIDLAMHRNDYEIFCKVAPYELASYMFLQSAYTEKDYGAPHIKIRNSQTTGATKYDFEFGYNKGIFIDIFPIDRIPDDESEFKRMCQKIAKQKRILDIGVRKFYYIGSEIITETEKEEARSIIEKEGLKQVYAAMESMCAEHINKKTKRCSWLLFHLDDDIYYESSDYEESLYVPFEHLSIPVPNGYDRILTTRYGEYMKPVKAGVSHGDLIVNVDIPYYDYKD